MIRLIYSICRCQLLGLSEFSTTLIHRGRLLELDRDGRLCVEQHAYPAVTDGNADYTVSMYLTWAQRSEDSCRVSTIGVEGQALAQNSRPSIPSALLAGSVLPKGGQKMCARKSARLLQPAPERLRLGSEVLDTHLRIPCHFFFRGLHSVIHLIKTK